MPYEELQIDAQLREQLDRAGLEFMAEILEIETGAHPTNIDALAELGHVLSRLGRIDDGFVVDRRLVELAPDNPNVHYNLACSQALLDQVDEALDSLETAVRLGYSDAGYLERDDDLRSLHEEPRFGALVEQLRSPRG